jgi:hypothetical protein
MREPALVFRQQIKCEFRRFPTNGFCLLIGYRMFQGKRAHHAISNGLHGELQVLTGTLIDKESSRRWSYGGNGRFKTIKFTTAAVPEERALARASKDEFLAAAPQAHGSGRRKSASSP